MCGKIPTYIIGTGGLGRGLLEIIKLKVNHEANWEIAGFIDDNESLIGKEINGIKVLGHTKVLKDVSRFSNVIIAVASPFAKQEIYHSIKENHNLFFPNLVHPNVFMSETLNIGIGNIISANVVFSANVNVGSFNLIHFNSTIGHDVKIGDFNSVYPGCNISGYATLNNSIVIGTNTAILPNVTLEKNVIVGAGAVVTKDIKANSKVVGVPAKKLGGNL